MFQIQDQSLRPLTTAHLAQTMSLLALSNLELRERVLEELNQNPALELVEEGRCPTCGKPNPHDGQCSSCSVLQADQEAVVFLSSRDSSGIRLKSQPDYEDLENDPAAPEDLALHVMKQLAADIESSERELAVYILSSLDEDGFLLDPPAILARFGHFSLDQVYEIIDLIKRVDPPGLATSGPREALLAQLSRFDGSDAQVQLAHQIISEYFEKLAEKDFKLISTELNLPLSEIEEVAKFVQEQLNPYPARIYWGSGKLVEYGDPNVFYNPDVRITSSQQNGSQSLVVEIFSPMTGTLQVNRQLQKAVIADEDLSEEWKKHLEQASLFVKCMQQRGNTMRRLMTELVQRQGEFIRGGDLHLLPTTRAELAEKLEVHESTISRAVSGKSVALPDGRIVPLSKFFDRSLPVRTRIKELIEAESKPLTDEKISGILKNEGICVARRTVAKYRAMEGILSARMRGKLKPVPSAPA